MTDPKLIWLVFLIILSLVQILYMLVKFFTNRKEKTSDADAPDNPGHGERIATLEGQMKALITNNEKDHGLIRKDINKLFTLFEGIKK